MSDTRKRVAYRLFARTRFNRHLIEMLKLARKLHASVSSFEGHNSDSVMHNLEELGMDGEMFDLREVQLHMEDVNAVRRDVVGFLWSLDVFISRLETDACDPPKTKGGA